MTAADPVPAPPRRAEFFDSIADEYAANRPGYPEELFDSLVQATGIEAGSTVLEVGCGTGQATLSLARRGFSVLCLEPGAHLAHLARQVLRPYHNVSVDQCRFEDWQPTSRFSLVFSAQAYHWIDPDVGLEKPRQVLGPGGAVALIWNVEQRISDALRVAVRRAYERHAPHLIDNFRYGPGRVRIATINRFASSPLYRAIGRREFPWRQRYSAPEYIRLIGTYSKHRRLNAASRTALFETIEAAIADAGGSIDVAYDAMCCMFSPVAES